MSSDLSRRDALRSFGLLGLGAGLSTFTPTASAAPTASRRRDHHLAPFYQRTMGDTRLTVVQEAKLQFPPAAVSGGAPDGAVQELFESYNLPSEYAEASLGVLLLQRGDRNVLIDTGLGDYELGAVTEGGGRLVEALGMLGLGADAIDTVVISHLHPDHLGGASMNGSPTFPNADYVMPAPEKQYIDEYQMTGNEGMDGTIEFARQKLAPIEQAGGLGLFADGDEIAPGLTAVAAPGHTPGHFAFMLEDGGEQLLLPTDTANHYVAQFEHPEWLFAFDAMPEQTVATRRKLLGRAADDGLRVWATHFPFPGFGYVVRHGEGFRFVPAS